MAEVVESIDLRSVSEIPGSDVARGTFVAIAGSNLPVKNFLAWVLHRWKCVTVTFIKTLLTSPYSSKTWRESPAKSLILKDHDQGGLSLCGSCSGRCSTWNVLHVRACPPTSIRQGEPQRVQHVPRGTLGHYKRSEPGRVPDQVGMRAARESSTCSSGNMETPYHS
jgi:hypothetical protein